MIDSFLLKIYSAVPENTKSFLNYFDKKFFF